MAGERKDRRGGGDEQEAVAAGGTRCAAVCPSPSERSDLRTTHLGARGRGFGAGYGAGYGRGRGYGRGFGWRAPYPAQGAGYGPSYGAPYQMDPSEEMGMLRNEAESMKRGLDDINRRIEELEKGASSE